MKLRRLSILLLVFLLLTLSTGGVLAAQPPDKTVVESDETVNNDIALFGEDLEIEEGAAVNGDVALFGGDAVIAGTVNGDVVLFGGDLTVVETAVFNGDCALLGGELLDNREEGTGGCDILVVGPDFIPALPNLPSILDSGRDIEISAPRFSAGRHFSNGLAETIGQTLVMALLAFGAASLLPNHLNRMEGVIRRQPVASGVVGLLTAVAVPSLIALLAIATAILIFICIGILGVPIIFVLAVGLAAGMALGWITLGDLIGRWLAERLNLKKRNLATTAVLGTAVLTFGVGLLGVLPFMIGEGLISIILGSIGLGAATLTRFGTRPYPLGYTVGNYATEDPDKVTAVLETLPVEDVADLKDN